MLEVGSRKGVFVWESRRGFKLGGRVGKWGVYKGSQGEVTLKVFAK